MPFHTLHDTPCPLLIHPLPSTGKDRGNKTTKLPLCHALAFSTCLHSSSSTSPEITLTRGSKKTLVGTDQNLIWDPSLALTYQAPHHSTFTYRLIPTPPHLLNPIQSFTTPSFRNCIRNTASTKHIHYNWNQNYLTTIKLSAVCNIQQTNKNLNHQWTSREWKSRRWIIVST